MDDEPGVSDEDVANAIATDTRFARIHESIAVQTELRDNPVIKAIMGAVWQDAMQAMEEAADTSPTDHAAVALLLVRFRTQVYIRRSLNAIIQRGQAAEASVRAESQARSED